MRGGDLAHRMTSQVIRDDPPCPQQPRQRHLDREHPGLGEHRLVHRTGRRGPRTGEHHVPQRAAQQRIQQPRTPHDRRPANTGNASRQRPSHPRPLRSLPREHERHLARPAIGHPPGHHAQAAARPAATAVQPGRELRPRPRASTTARSSSRDRPAASDHPASTTVQPRPHPARPLPASRPACARSAAAPRPDTTHGTGPPEPWRRARSRRPTLSAPQASRLREDHVRVGAADRRTTRPRPAAAAPRPASPAPRSAAARSRPTSRCAGTAAQRAAWRAVAGAACAMIILIIPATPAAAWVRGRCST